MTEFDDLINKDITASVIVGEKGRSDNADNKADKAESDQRINAESKSDKADSFKTIDKDHPAIALIDIGVEESVKYCKKEKLPEPNLSLWHNFSRGYLNRALWHYAPDGDLPDSPALALLLGVGGLSVCYMPVIMSVYRKYQEEDKGGKELNPPKHPPEIKADKPPEDRPKPDPEIPKFKTLNVSREAAARIQAMGHEAKGYAG